MNGKTVGWAIVIVLSLITICGIYVAVTPHTPVGEDSDGRIEYTITGVWDDYNRVITFTIDLKETPSEPTLTKIVASWTSPELTEVTLTDKHTIFKWYPTTIWFNPKVGGAIDCSSLSLDSETVTFIKAS